MARIGLIYQGRNHLTVVEGLAKKILGEENELVPRLGGSWPGVVGVVTGLLEALQVEHIQNPIRKVIVVVDADKEEPTRREERLRSRVGSRTYRFGTVHYHAIARKIETWLLGDPEAVNRAAGHNIPPVNDPESLLGPRQHLIQQLRNSGVDYDPGFVQRATAAINLDRLQANCRRFNRFRQQLEDC